MKKIVSTITLATVITGFSFPGFAGPGQFSGPLSTLGNVSTQQTILSATVNPAAGEFVVEDTYRWSYLNGVGLGFELGQLDNLADDLDALTEELDRLEQQANDNFTVVSQADVESVQDQFNNFLIALGQKGTLQFGAQTRVPGFPMAMRHDYIKGVVTLDAKVGVDVGAKFIDSPLEIINPTLFDPNYRLKTDTAIDLTSVVMTAFSVGYSHDLANSYFSGSAGDVAQGKVSAIESRFKNHFAGSGDRLLVGLELTLYKADMSTQIIAIDQQDTNDDFGDVISDEYENNQVSSTDIGLDLGVLWISHQFQLGATWKNINEPSFDSSKLGVNCLSLQTASAQNNCAIAAQLGANGRIDLTPEYVMENQLSVEGTMYTGNRHWNIAASLDLNDVVGPIGNDYQWMAASASYFSDSLWVPMARVGYRSNLSGSELSYANVGFTLFGGSHIDLSLALDSVSVDDDDLPRSIAINFGFERRF